MIGALASQTGAVHNQGMDILAWIFSAILFAALLALAIIDARTFRLPDVITLPMIPLGLIAAWALDQTLWLHALGAALGYGVLVMVEKIYERARGRPGLGRGDAKLYALGGAWCSAAALPFILLASSAAALIYIAAYMAVTRRSVNADQMIAFGPFLGFGIALVYALQRLGYSAPLGF